MYMVEDMVRGQKGNLPSDHRLFIFCFRPKLPFLRDSHLLAGGKYLDSNSTFRIAESA